jgi:diguanylate cyclase
VHPLAKLFFENEDWLMLRVLKYAKDFGFAKYTSTLEEAWRLSISGLTASLCNAIDTHATVPELAPDDDHTSDPLSRFGLIEAQRHRQRGVTLAMYLGLMKYYRQSYVDLLAEKPPAPETFERDRLFVDRCFDRIEISFCQEWTTIDPNTRLDELQTANRFMTNEKNAYLTAFESLSDPVLMLDAEEKLVNLNQAASLLVDPSHVPGGHYYQAGARDDGTMGYGKHAIDKICIGRPVDEVYPWLTPTLRSLRDKRGETGECRATINGNTVYFDVKRADMLDVSEKFTSSIVILRNSTKRTMAETELKRTVAELGQALSEVKSLSGLLPICANCKNVRDDKGYWLRVEQYITNHTGATFSHGICPDCARKLYPEIADKVVSAEAKGQGGNG